MNFYSLGQQEAFVKFAVEYRGKTFPGYNQPIASDQPDKKKMVLAKKGDTVKLIHFGHSNYKHNYSDSAKKNYLTRSAGIKDKDGNLTKDNKLSANYWARRVLWPKGEADGSAKEGAEASLTKHAGRLSQQAITALEQSLGKPLSKYTGSRGPGDVVPALNRATRLRHIGDTRAVAALEHPAVSRAYGSDVGSLPGGASPLADATDAIYGHRLSVAREPGADIPQSAELSQRLLENAAGKKFEKRWPAWRQSLPTSSDGGVKESEEKPWDKKNPKKESKPLSSDQKSEAKRRAQAAGRPYPNLVDNMNAAKRR